MIAGRYEPLADDLARDVELDRIVRLRWIDAGGPLDDPRLSHPNVVRVYDVGEHEGRRFVAVEHVEGVPLAATTPLPLDDAVVVGVRAARALAAAHELGLVHRGEVVVRADGVPKLSGFAPGEPGEDVRALARALERAAPALGPLDADTPRALERALERARPAATLRLPALPPLRRPQRSRLVLALAVVAAVAVAIGLAAAFSRGGGGSTAQQPPRAVRIRPVGHPATAERQARDLAAWLTRWSR